MKAILVTCLILCLVLGLSVNPVSAMVTGTFHFQAYIDGSDYVYIQNAGGKVWYEHIQYTYPGEHAPYSIAAPAATTIDGVNWYPVWNRTTKMSNIYTSSSPQNYPSGEWTALSITKITNVSDTTQSRGPVTIIDFPSSNNSYTAKVLINDDTGSLVFSGSTWYVFELSWVAPQLIPEFSTTIAGISTLVMLSIAIIYAKKNTV